MKLTRRVAMLVAMISALAVMAGAVMAQDEEPGVSVSLDASVYSKYIWRGIVVNDDWVLQPSLTIGFPSGWAFNFWGNVDLTDEMGERGNFTEIDYTVGYDWSTDAIDWSAGLINYSFPQGGATTAEVYLSAGFGGTLAPAVAVYYDFDEIEGYYVNAGIGYSVPFMMSEETEQTIDLAANLGYGSSDYNLGYFGVDSSAVTDLLISASTTFETESGWAIAPSVNYSKIIDSDIECVVADDSNFYYGITFSKGW